jgi:hypothetical protein
MKIDETSESSSGSQDDFSATPEASPKIPLDPDDSLSANLGEPVFGEPLDGGDMLRQPILQLGSGLGSAFAQGGDLGLEARHSYAPLVEAGVSGDAGQDLFHNSLDLGLCSGKASIRVYLS